MTVTFLYFCGQPNLYVNECTHLHLFNFFFVPILNIIYRQIFYWYKFVLSVSTNIYMYIFLIFNLKSVFLIKPYSYLYKHILITINSVRPTFITSCRIIFSIVTKNSIEKKAWTSPRLTRMYGFYFFLRFESLITICLVLWYKRKLK